MQGAKLWRLWAIDTQREHLMQLVTLVSGQSPATDLPWLCVLLLPCLFRLLHWFAGSGQRYGLYLLVIGGHILVQHQDGQGQMLGRLIDVRNSVDQGVSCGRKALSATQHDAQLGRMIEMLALIAGEMEKVSQDSLSLSLSPHLLVQTVADGEHHRGTHQGTGADVTLAKVVNFLVHQANGSLIRSSAVPSTARCSRRLYATLLGDLAVRVAC